LYIDAPLSLVSKGLGVLEDTVLLLLLFDEPARHDVLV